MKLGMGCEDGMLLHFPAISFYFAKLAHVFSQQGGRHGVCLGFHDYFTKLLAFATLQPAQFSMPHGKIIMEILATLSLFLLLLCYKGRTYAFIV